MSANHINLVTPATEDNFDERRYLDSNPDVARAVARKQFPSGIEHFRKYGQFERRPLREAGGVREMRKAKLSRIARILDPNLPSEILDGGKISYLTGELRKSSNIADTDNVSSNGYDVNVINLIEKHKDGIVLDCGAGLRNVYYENVVNFEIVNYDTTDILGVGERLPFKDNSFDLVISIAVLEHVRDPFACAKEISRVLKPGGDLYCCVPFLQPYHGYPHHYFNASHQGIARLFEDTLRIVDVTVLDSTHPIFSLSWILQSWAKGLNGPLREKFLQMTVSDLIQDPSNTVREPFCQSLSREKWLELASATVLRATKTA